jgi:thioesterase domain-containing protein
VRPAALPFNQETRQPESGYLPPRNHLELVMTEIWGEVLGLNQVSVQDNFFELGGHSLSAARLIARLRSTLGMDLPLRCIFLDPTIAGLSSHIAYDVAAKTYRYTSEIPKWKCLVPAQPKGSRTPFFFVGGAYLGGADDTLMVLSQLFPRFKKDQPIFGLRPRGSDGVSEGYSSIAEAVREYVSELRAVQPKGPYLLGGHCVGGIAALEMAKLLMDEGEEVRLVVLFDTSRPSPMRNLRIELNHQTQRAGRVSGLIWQTLRANAGERRKIVDTMIRRKLRLERPENVQVRTEVRHYESMIQYRRLLNKHTIASYPGRVTLIANQYEADFDRNLGWKGVAQGGVDVHVVPGDHASILSHHGKEVGELILQSIDEALADIHWQAAPAEVKVS